MKLCVLNTTKLLTSHASLELSYFLNTELKHFGHLSILSQTTCSSFIDLVVWSVARITQLYHSIYHNIFIRKSSCRQVYNRIMDYYSWTSASGTPCYPPKWGTTHSSVSQLVHFRQFGNQICLILKLLLTS